MPSVLTHLVKLALSISLIVLPLGCDAGSKGKDGAGSDAAGGSAASGASGVGGQAPNGGFGEDCAPSPAPLAVQLPANVPVANVATSGISDLRRGINLGNALEAPEEGDWGVTLEAANFEIVADAGFDHVRIPVRFSAHTSSGEPFTIDEAFFSRVDWALDQAERNGLAVVLDVHHFEELLASPQAQKPRLVAIWRQIAARYRDRPASLKYELLNEPNSALDSQWNGIYPDALAAVRTIDPTRTVILDSSAWASALQLQNLTLVDDPALVVTFHMYEPILFTHQGASWMTPEYQTTGISFPGPPCQRVVPAPGAQAVAWANQWLQAYNQTPAATNPGGPKTIENIFAAVDAFVARTGRAVYLGEFAAIDSADRLSREHWVRLVREHAEARQIPWAYWDDGGAFRAYSATTREWVPELERALLE